MTKTVIIGGSVAGLASALVCSDLGHDVLIVERDAAEPPDGVEEAHRDWQRATVPQTRHSHAFGSLGVNLLRDRAPDVYRRLLSAGAQEIDLAERMPPMLPDRTRQPGDEQLMMLGCRRTTFELELRRTVRQRAGVEIRRGSTVRGLRIADTGGPRVTGVHLGDGATVDADLVIDAGGRRSAAEQWLSDAGVEIADSVTSPADITYFTRFYHRSSPAPAGPLNRGFGAGGLWNHYTGVMFLGDNGTFSVSLGVLPDDAPMKLLRHEAAFTAAVRATPLLAPWVAPGASEPISGVYAMGGLDNSLRGIATTAQTPVAGLFHIGDSAGTTNPAYGRGVSLALAHAFAFGDLLAEHPTIDHEQVRMMAVVTERLLRPWFEEARANDAGRAALWRATVAGRPAPTPPPGVLTFGAVAEAAGVDAVVWRRLVRVMMTLDDPRSLYQDDDIRNRVEKALGAGPSGPMPPAPTRDELVRVVAAAAG